MQGLRDPYREGASPVHRMSPRAKVAFTVGYILALTLTPPGAWEAFLGWALVWLAVALLSGVGLRRLLARSVVALPFVLAAASLLFRPGPPPYVGVTWGAVSLHISRDVIVRFVTVLLRSWLGVLATVLLLATTRFVDLARALRAWRVPAPLVNILVMTYRYLFVLVDEAGRMQRARTARSAAGPPGRLPRWQQVAWQARVTGQMAGALFLRSLERSERVYYAMLSRGFRGDVQPSPAREVNTHMTGPQDTHAVLHAHDLEFTYPDGHQALRGVTLHIARGEKVALVGPNGAGKSTLILHFNGILRPTRGRIWVDGLEVTEEHLPQIRARVGLVFQDPDDQLFSPTVFDDVAFGPRHMGLPEPEVQERVAEALAAVGLTGFEDRVPHHLSAGEKKRVAIATVLAMRPSILVLDEPTTGLDARARRALLRLLCELPVTMLIATHDLRLASVLCTRTLVMDGGRIVADGPTAELLRDADFLWAHGLESPWQAPDEVCTA